MSDKEKLIESVYICYVKVKEILDNNVGTAIKRTFNLKCKAQKGFKYVTEAITKRAKTNYLLKILKNIILVIFN